MQLVLAQGKCIYKRTFSIAFFYGGVVKELKWIVHNLSSYRAQQTKRTCVPRVNDAFNDMFVIKLCEGEGVKVLVHHHIFCLNVDG